MFGGPTNSTPINGRPRPLVALDERKIDLFITYCSSGKQIAGESANYRSLSLPVSRQASSGAADFVMYLLSPPGQASLQSFGFIPVALPAAR